MQFKVIIILFTLATTGYAHDIDNNDIPLPCHDVCQPVLNLTADCDRRIVDDDSATYRDCICQAQNAQSDVPNCAACVSANGGTDFDDDDDTTPDNDALDIIRDCNFSTTTWSSGVTATSTSADVGATTGTGTVAASTGATGAAAAGTSVSRIAGAAAKPTSGVKVFGLAALIGLPVVL